MLMSFPSLAPYLNHKTYTQPTLIPSQIYIFPLPILTIFSHLPVIVLPLNSLPLNPRPFYSCKLDPKSHITTMKNTKIGSLPFIPIEPTFFHLLLRGFFPRYNELYYYQLSCWLDTPNFRQLNYPWSRYDAYRPTAQNINVPPKVTIFHCLLQ